VAGAPREQFDGGVAHHRRPGRAVDGALVGPGPERLGRGRVGELKAPGAGNESVELAIAESAAVRERPAREEGEELAGRGIVGDDPRSGGGSRSRAAPPKPRGPRAPPHCRHGG